MIAMIVQRLLQSIVVLLLVSVLVFFGVYTIGDPLDLLVAPDSTFAEIAALRVDLGLDLPIWHQYFVFLGNILKGDLGRSFIFGQPTLDLVVERLPASIELALVAFVLAVLIGLPLGIASAIRPGSLFDRTTMSVSILGFSIPNFWQGLMLIMIFSVWWPIFPPTGRGEVGTILGIHTSLATLDGLRHIFLPALNLALFKIAMLIRLSRSGMREVMLMDYIKYARAKGLNRYRIILVHGLKNTMIPLITVIGMQLGSLVAYGVVTETIFSWPGMGKLTIDSINNLDRPIIVGYLLVVVLMFIILNLIVDLLYAVFDPRIRLQRGMA